MNKQNRALSLFSVTAESAKNLDIQVRGLPETPEPEKPARGSDINVKFTEKEKEEIRKLSVERNTGMSTIVYQAWQFYEKFKGYHHDMLRHEEFVKDTVKNLVKHYD